jgi:hypothetical protein
MSLKLHYACAAMLSVSLLVGCSSTPTWGDISEADIAGWREIGLDASGANQYIRQGFVLSSATPWVEAGFDAKTAAKWAEHQFSTEEASAWTGAGFSLSQARDNRARGLTPVR